MNALILLADGFETVEALQTYDVLKRTHRFNVLLCSTKQSLMVTSSHGVVVQAETTLSSIDESAFDMFILPGGKLGVENLKANPNVRDLVCRFMESGRDVHAICAAPSILGELGYLDGLPYTCFPGFQAGKGRWQDKSHVITEHIVTGRSMGNTLPFAKAIVEKYYGKEALDAIRPGIEGLE